MIKGNIFHFLRGITTKEQVDLFESICDLLSGLGLNGHEFTMSELIESNEPDANNILAAIDATLTGAMVNLLRQFGITVIDEVNSRICYAILNGVINSANFDEPQVLVDLCSSEESPEEILADILEIMTGQSGAEFLPYIERVSPDLINRLHEQSDAYANEADEIDGVKQAAITRTRSFLTVYQPPVFIKAVNEHLVFGADADALLSHYQEDINKLDLEDAVAELSAFMLASNLTYAQAIELTKEYCQGWWNTRKNNATRIHKLVLDHFKAAGVS